MLHAINGMTWLAVAGYLTLLTGCKQPTEPKVDDDAPKYIQPLAVGNYWMYINPGYPGYLDTFRVEISRTFPITVNDEQLDAYVETNYIGDLTTPQSPEWLSGNDDGGYYILGGIDKADSIFIKEIYRPYPAEAGTKFLSRRPVLSYQTQQFEMTADTVEVVATNENIDTPVGTFSCYVYRAIIEPPEDVNYGSVVYEYYAPGVGMVAKIFKTQSDERTRVEYLLSDFKVK